MLPTGQVTKFPISGEIHALAVGPDKLIWFLASSAIGRVTAEGSVSTFPLPVSTDKFVDTGRGVYDTHTLIVGPDQNLWFPYVQPNGTGAIGKYVVLFGK
jgi:streptogramin lyase